MIRPEFLEMLQCPEARRPLAIAPDELIARINAAIAARRLHNRAGELLDKPLDGGLLRDDGIVLYPIRDGIPVLLIDEAIDTSAVGPKADPSAAG